MTYPPARLFLRDTEVQPGILQVASFEGNPSNEELRLVTILPLLAESRGKQSPFPSFIDDSNSLRSVSRMADDMIANRGQGGRQVKKAATSNVVLRINSQSGRGATAN